MAKKNPAKLYLKSLSSEQSRVSMRSYLNRAIQIISGEDILDDFDWSTLTYDMAYDLKNVLTNEGKAPSTINSGEQSYRGSKFHRIL